MELQRERVAESRVDARLDQHQRARRRGEALVSVLDEVARGRVLWRQWARSRDRGCVAVRAAAADSLVEGYVLAIDDAALRTAVWHYAAAALGLPVLDALSRWADASARERVAIAERAAAGVTMELRGVVRASFLGRGRFADELVLGVDTLAALARLAGDLMPAMLVELPEADTTALAAAAAALHAVAAAAPTLPVALVVDAAALERFVSGEGALRRWLEASRVMVSQRLAGQELVRLRGAEVARRPASPEIEGLLEHARAARPAALAGDRAADAVLCAAAQRVLRALLLAEVSDPALWDGTTLRSEALGLAVLVDGFGALADANAYRRDRQEDARLQLESYVVVRLLADDVIACPSQALTTVRAVLERRLP